MGEILGRWYGVVGMGFYLGALVVCVGLLWVVKRRRGTSDEKR